MLVLVQLICFSIYSVLPAEIVCTGTIEKSKAVPFLLYIPKFSYASDFNILFSYWNRSRYADFLCRLNDDRNVRALFERALSSLPPEQSVEVWSLSN